MSNQSEGVQLFQPFPFSLSGGQRLKRLPSNPPAGAKRRLISLAPNTEFGFPFVSCI